jgi:hypothetical protein
MLLLRRACKRGNSSDCLPRLPRVSGGKGFLTAADRVVLFNTGTGLKYTDVIAEAFGLKRPS